MKRESKLRVGGPGAEAGGAASRCGRARGCVLLWGRLGVDGLGGQVGPRSDWALKAVTLPAVSWRAACGVVDS